MNKLTCLFGFHYYSDELTKDKNNNSIHLCKICKLNGHFKDSDGFEHRCDYDNKGNLMHSKDSTGFEYWYDYDNKGNRMHYKDSNGNEQWHDYDDKGNEIHGKDFNGYERWLHKGECVDKKPKNWKYEIQN